MKKFLIVILLCVFCFIPVDATSNIEIESIKAIKSSDGVVLNTKDKVDAIFNDLNQQVKYEATIKNNSDKKMYINFLEVENKSEKFMEYKLDSKSENIVLEPNESSKVNFYINTLAIEGAGRNLDDNVKINFLVSDKIFNPNTFSNIFDLIILLLVLGSTMYFIRKNKKVKTLVLIIGISIISINYVSANDYIKVQLLGKVKYTSQNNIITTGTTLNNKQADYTNSKEVWAYYDKVKNVEVKSLLNEPNKYYKKFDLTENKTGRVMAYLTENNDKDTPYDLTIMSQGVIIANPDSSFMFSFPKTEKVEGLSNVDFSETTTMQGMFIGNEKLEKIDTEAIELKSTIDTSYMFYDCEEIEHGRSDFNLENVTNTTMMFTPYLFNEVKDGAKVETDELFAKSPSETNLRGNFIRKDTLEDEYPIYYYRGAVTNNNVKFAGFCWQIVRTTETGGVKLVYNGTPNTDGTCKGPGEDISIGQSAFNSTRKTIAQAGYMYGTQPISTLENISINKTISNSISLYNDNNLYYYAKEYEYKDGKYILKQPEQKLWSENYQDLNGYYTCKSTENTPCDALYYIVKAYSTSYYMLQYKNGELPEKDTITIGKGYKKNENGTYELIDKIIINKSDFVKDTKKYEYYYVCNDLKAETCNPLYIIVTYGVYNMNIEKINLRLYGNDVEYKDGKYTLKDTYLVDNFAQNIKKLSKKYHYTCKNTTGDCENVYYIFDYQNSYYNTYLTFSNGKKIEGLLEEVYENKNNSDIKNVIDNWYSNNLTSYTSQLEDTIWCNDRKLYGALTGKDQSTEKGVNEFGASLRGFTDIPNQMTLECEQYNDRFTVNKENGNGALTYPIGMLTLDEAMLAGYGYVYNNYAGESYLAKSTIKTSYHVMTPDFVTSGEIYSLQFNQKGMVSAGTMAYSKAGVRPAISLKNKIKYTTGDGTKEKPYVIE